MTKQSNTLINYIIIKKQENEKSIINHYDSFIGGYQPAQIFFMKAKNDDEIKIRRFLFLWLRRIYVIAFNLYAWYWLYKLIFIIKSTNFEDYLIYFFTTVGVLFFVFDGKDVFLKKINKVDDIQED